MPERLRKHCVWLQSSSPSVCLVPDPYQRFGKSKKEWGISQKPMALNLEGLGAYPKKESILDTNMSYNVGPPSYKLLYPIKYIVTRVS